MPPVTPVAEVVIGFGERARRSDSVRMLGPRWALFGRSVANIFEGDFQFIFFSDDTS